MIGSLGYGAWFGFPVQDDTYLIRLLRLGGPARIVQQHPDRPVYGFLLGMLARIGGESKSFYIAVGLLAWLLFAAEAVWLWRLLFPIWSSAWPAVGLAVVSPVVVSVQFSTVTTVIPCLLPVMLVLIGTIIALLREGRPGPPVYGVLFLVAGAATLVSEYGLASVLAACALLMVLDRWRPSLSLLSGSVLGYTIFTSVARLSLRRETNPGIQAEHFFSHPWRRPLRVASAAWSCIAGAWGRAAAGVSVDWSSKSTVVGFGLALVAAAAVALFWVSPPRDDPERMAGRKLASLVLAVLAGLYPAVALMGWPLTLAFQTRFLLPALAFAACATIAALLLLLRARVARLGLCVLAFLAGHRLVLQAVEERKLQVAMTEVGSKLRRFVDGKAGLVVVVCPDRTGQSDIEAMAKVTAHWPIEEAERLVVLRPSFEGLGNRSECRTSEEIRLRPPVLRWPRAREPVRLTLWDEGEWGRGEVDPEPYYRGCVAQGDRRNAPDF